MSSDESKKDVAYLPRSWGARRDRRKRPASDEISGEQTDSAQIAQSDAAAAPETEQLPDESHPRRREPEGERVAAPHRQRHGSRRNRGRKKSETPGNHGELPAEDDATDFDEDICDIGAPDWLQPGDMVSDRLSAKRDSDVSTDSRMPLVKVRVVGVRFSYACRVYHFDTNELDLAAGDWVLVKTEQGLGLGMVATPPFDQELDAAQLDGLRKVIRKATKDDFHQKSRCSQKEADAFKYCHSRIEALALPMKLVNTECFFDGSKYVFYFTAEGRVDFRELVKLLVARFPVRIEMRQIGVRHEAKMTGGIACCGQELCCSRFLTDFRPVSVKMAKAQNLSLNPTKISGVCGRLMCCLAYEYDTYEEFRKGLPKVGKSIVTNKGDGVVVKHDPLSETVLIRREDESTVEVRREDIIVDESSPLPKKGKKKGDS